MVLFQNDFFSIAGQQERFSNVGNTLLAAVGLKKGGVISNTGIKIPDFVLSAVASHPFTTAAFVAVAAAPTAALGAAKTGGGIIASEFGKLSLGYKAAAVVAAPVVASALVSSPKLRGEVLNAPSSLANFGSNIGGLVENPTLSNLGNTIKENPAISGALAIAGVTGLGLGASSILSGLSTRQNTKAILENTKATALGKSSIDSVAALYPTNVTGDTRLASPLVDSSVKTPILTSSARRVSRHKKKKKAPSEGRITQNVKVYNIDDRDVYDRKVYK